MAAGPNQTITLPPGAVLTKLTATVTAAGTARAVAIGSVANLHPESGAASAKSSSIIADFGTRCVVSALSARDWRGLDYFDDVADAFVTTVHANDGNPSKYQFGELLTRRLRIVFPDDGVIASDVAISHSIVIATPPADLEIFVNGARAWLQAGSAEPTKDTKRFEAAVPITRTAQDELDAGRARLECRVRSRTPADLTLELHGEYLHSHDVTFPEGPSHAITTTAEGDVLVDLRLPGDAAGRAIRGVHATLAAQSGPERVSPPTRPPLSRDAALVVDPDRAAAIQLPGDATASIASFSGVRIPVRVGAEGAELRGVLRVDAGGAPGAPLPRGQLGPAALEPGTPSSADDPPWVSLLAAKPLKLPATGLIWVDLVATRGSVEWPLPAGTKDDERALVLRPTPGGSYRRLSSVTGIVTDFAAVRVIGVPPASAPVFPALLGVDGVDLTDPEKPGVRSELVATGGGAATVSMRLEDANVQATAHDGASRLRLRLTARTAGTFTLSDVAVQYDPTTLDAP